MTKCRILPPIYHPYTMEGLNFSILPSVFPKALFLHCCSQRLQYTTLLYASKILWSSVTLKSLSKFTHISQRERLWLNSNWLISTGWWKSYYCFCAYMLINEHLQCGELSAGSYTEKWMQWLCPERACDVSSPVLWEFRRRGSGQSVREWPGFLETKGPNHSWAEKAF